ncbi:MAG: sodium:solute symporter family protein [Verrucomicrobiae bacterium]|nr:sodium:solute symporter family protein [Verrucomicrobiae bacterium]
MVLFIIVTYMLLLLALGLMSGRKSQGTSKDFFVASHSIGPFLLLMSVFGTTMTAFALVGSTGKAFERGIGTYGLMASSSGLVHAACFFLIGIRLWSLGKKYGFVTQIQFFRERFESRNFGFFLFPVLVALVIPYLLIGVIGAGKTIQPVTAGMFSFFKDPNPIMDGGVPPWLSGLVVCIVVLAYVFTGGSRGAAWANTFQTLVFMIMGVVAFTFILRSLGGLENAANVVPRVTDKGTVVQDYGINPETHKVEKLAEPKVVASLVNKERAKDLADTHPHLARGTVEVAYKAKVDGNLVDAHRELGVPLPMFLSYLLIPLSVGMFPHLFQHWLTARSAKAFKLTLVAHPLCIMIVWVPCVLIGIWASGLMPFGMNPSAVLSKVINDLIASPALTGFLTAGVLAAIMSSLDSQFLCLGTMFTNDIVLSGARKDKYSDKQIIWIARAFIIAIVAITYIVAMVAIKSNVFDLAVWCFSGFAGLTPMVIAALYWKRANKYGGYASVTAVVITWSYFFKMAYDETGKLGGEYTVTGGVMPVTFCVIAGAVAMIAVSLFTPKPSEETIRRFFPESL